MQTYSLVGLGKTLAIKGQHQEALNIFQKTGNKYWLNITLGRMGEKDKLSLYVKELENKFAIITQQKTFVMERMATPFNIACLYAELGDKENLFKWLYKAYNIGDPRLGYWLTLTPLLDKYRSEPRYLELLKRMKLNP